MFFFFLTGVTHSYTLTLAASVSHNSGPFFPVICTYILMNVFFVVFMHYDMLSHCFIMLSVQYFD